MMHQQAFQMGISVGFARVMVPVVLPKRGEFLEPLINIRDQAVFSIVDPDTGGDVHG